jgi:hypothetical protein
MLIRRGGEPRTICCRGGVLSTTFREGAAADNPVVDGYPLEDISVLASGGNRLSIIMKEGRFHKRRI